MSTSYGVLPGPVRGKAPASPRVPDGRLAAHPESTRTPAPHTPTEVAALVELLRGAHATSVTTGTGRHSASRATAAAVADGWIRAGGAVLDTLDWPAEAASWSTPARRMVRSHPDAWVVIDNPAGCAQLARRLAELEDWSPLRTFGTASLDSVDTLVLAGRGVLTGMRGVGGDGAIWRVGDGLLYRDQATGAL